MMGAALDQVEMTEVEITKKVRAIVQFGPAHSTSGFRPGEYFQCVIDPNMVSESGKYIRFDAFQKGEIHGWQRVEALTVCEILGPADEYSVPVEGYTVEDGAKVVMRAIA